MKSRVPLLAIVPHRWLPAATNRCRCPVMVSILAPCQNFHLTLTRNPSRRVPASLSLKRNLSRASDALEIDQLTQENFRVG
jgi:hypothetical protein